MILVILGHPRQGSFNHAIADVIIKTLKNNGHKVISHDLYKEGFNAILTYDEISKNSKLKKAIKKHCTELSQAEGIIVIHPNWWGQPPAILKGWIDRVIRANVAYKFVNGDQGEGIPIGLLKARTALIFNTADTPMKREKKVFGDPLETLWKKCILEYCGVKKVYRKVYSVVVTSTPKQRKKWLEDVGSIVNKYFP